MNNFLLVIAAFLVLVFTALFAVPPLINWNDYRGAFEEEASRLLDREVRVGGDVSVRILPVPHVSFEKVRIADAPGVPGSFARADQFKMWLSVPPLLRGVIEARQIELEKPVIRLRTEEDGSGNWRKLQISNSHLAYIPRDVALNSVRINNGTLLLETSNGNEIIKVESISGEMTAVALTGPYKFIGTVPGAGEPRDVRFSTARIEENGDVRFSGSVRSRDNSLQHTLNGTLHDLLGKARAAGRLVSRAKPSSDAAGGRQVGYELAAEMKLDAEALRLDKIAVSFQDKNRQQTMNGKAVTSWRDGVVTETELVASWLDLDAIAGMQAQEGPLRIVESLLTNSFGPLATGVTSVDVKIGQANLAGTAISGLKGRLIRRDGVTKIEALRASLPGLTALAVDGFLERRDGSLQFDGNMLMRSASFTELAQWLRADLSEAAQRALATSVSLSGNVRVRPKSVELSDTIIRIADAEAEGGGRYSWAGRPTLIADIDANTVSLEKFGRDLLVPSKVANVMGFQTAESSGWLRGTDLTLRLRARRLSDGVRAFSDVDVDVGRNGDKLDLKKFSLTWDPGLKLELSGQLKDIAKHPRGVVTGTVAAASAKDGEHLSSMVSLAADANVDLAFVAREAPMRVAVEAQLGKGSANDPSLSNRIIADGTIGSDRIRIDAQTIGAISNWPKQLSEVRARITGSKALTTTRWLLGRPLGKDTSKAPKSAGSPATIVMTAAGTPSTDMKAFVRIAAANFLDADFSGDLHFPDTKEIRATWAGQLDIRKATTESLALLTWPSLRQHVANLPVRGRMAVSGNGDGYSIAPKRIRVGSTIIRGDMRLTPKSEQTASVLNGTLALTEASLPSMSGLLMRPVAAGSNTNVESDEFWPNTPFNFDHLAGITTDLSVKIGSLRVDRAGNKLRNAKFRVSTASSRIVVKDFSGRFHKATLQGNADFRKSQAGVKIAATISGKNIDFERWAPELAQANRLTGRADLKLEISGRALSPRSLSSVVTGNGELRLKGVRVPGMTSETITAAARKVIDGEIEMEALTDRVATLVREGAVELGNPKLKLRAANGTLRVPSIVFEQDEGALRNDTLVDLRQLRIDSQWTVTPAPQPRPDAPEQSVPLPSVTLIYSGPLANIDKIDPTINLGDLERELVVRKMEANVARLERLRREDEARAAAEEARRREIEEERRLSLEEEEQRRRQSQWDAATQSRPTPGSAANGIVPPKPSAVAPPAPR